MKTITKTQEKTDNYRIKGKIKGKRGGAFQGIIPGEGPEFGGSNLIYAPIWWNKTYKEVEAICDKIMERFPECECHPEKC